MPLTNRGKQQAMSVGIASVTRYAAFHLANDNELAGHGYRRKSLTPDQMNVSDTGVITGPQNLEIYQASDANAQRAIKLSLYDAENGGNQLYTPENLNFAPQAPGNGQAFRCTITLNP